MFGLAGVPSIVMFFGMIFMPESPRWLVFHNKKEKAVKILRKMRTEEEAEEELEAIVEEYEEHQKLKLGVFQFAKKLFTTRTVVLALIVGCGLQMFQQLSGINTIMYYSGNIIELAGFPGDAAIWLTCIPTFGNFVFTFIGEVLVDKLGRRKLVLGSVAGVIVSLLAISGVFHLLNERSLLVNSPYPNVTCHHDRCLYCVADESCGFCAAFNSSTDTYTYGTCSAVSESSNFGYFVGNNESVVTCGALSPMNSSQSDTMTVGELRWSKDSCTHDSIAPLAVVCLVLYLVFFAPGLAPVPWTVNSEIYPTWARGFGVSISSTANWVTNLVVSLTFLSLLDTLSPAVGFLMFAGFSIMAFIFIFLLLPETKKKSLEETGDLFRQPYFLRWCRNMRRYRRLHNVN
jgi:SP family myo-inositol transporter-like MFS transporter 13